MENSSSQGSLRTWAILTWGVMVVIATVMVWVYLFNTRYVYFPDPKGRGGGTTMIKKDRWTGKVFFVTGDGSEHQFGQH